MDKSRSDNQPPKYVPPPQIQIIDADEPNKADQWTAGFYMGAFIGIGIGMVLMKLLIKCIS